MGAHRLVDQLLVFQQLVEVSRSHRRPQPELQLAVKVFRRFGELAESGQHIGVAPSGREVEAQADLVAGENLLPADFQRLPARIDQFKLQIAVETPPGTHARSQQRLHFAIDPQQAVAVSRHLSDQDAIEAKQGLATQTGLQESPCQFIWQCRPGTQIDLFQPMLHQTTPENTARSGWQDFDQHIVFKPQPGFLFAQFHATKLGFGFFRIALAQVINHVEIAHRRIGFPNRQ